MPFPDSPHLTLPTFSSSNDVNKFGIDDDLNSSHFISSQFPSIPSLVQNHKMLRAELMLKN